MHKRSSLSAGLIVRHLLTNDEDVQVITRHIFPVIVDEATLPYVVYRRADLEAAPNSNGAADVLTFEIACYAASYAESVELAEAVRHALDGTQIVAGDLTLRACRIASAEELYDGDAYAQLLTYTARV
jgi:hypothetical protein